MELTHPPPSALLRSWGWNTWAEILACISNKALLEGRVWGAIHPQECAKSERVNKGGGQDFVGSPLRGPWHAELDGARASELGGEGWGERGGRV